ncbi:MAG TPA: Gfo/Idh/MocA family oxidoreductase [Geminicoccaceae bacterium]|nr:Gfo/Idh/MocA family oxidoreductase [Geminicoccus sp.]HMU48342.1 Gfo/Idh/MocA family oxidoreductase [Geminicoccaceae bacterium]
MAAKLRGALIGCGFFAQNHLNAWRDLAQDVDLVAVCDMDKAKAEAAAAKFGVPKVHTDAAAMFAAERPDFVDIVTTMPSHKALVLLAASHRVPTIVQKPFAPTWQECVDMVEACRDAGVPLMVHENFRFQAPMLAIADLLKQGVLGDLTWARLTWRTNYDVYAGQPYLSKEKLFILLDLGIHVLDLARVFMGEVERLSCETQSLKPGIAGEDMATVMLRHTSGTVSVVDCTYEAKRDPDPFPETLLEIEGRRGSLVLGPGLRLEITSDRVTTTRDLSTPLLGWTSHPWHVAQESVLNTQRHWVECLRQGREPATSGADNLKTYALVMAAYEAARTHGSVRPASWP